MDISSSDTSKPKPSSIPFHCESEPSIYCKFFELFLNMDIQDFSLFMNDVRRSIQQDPKHEVQFCYFLISTAIILLLGFLCFSIWPQAASSWNKIADSFNNDNGSMVSSTGSLPEKRGYGLYQTLEDTIDQLRKKLELEEEYKRELRATISRAREDEEQMKDQLKTVQSDLDNVKRALKREPRLSASHTIRLQTPVSDQELENNLLVQNVLLTMREKENEIVGLKQQYEAQVQADRETADEAFTHLRERFEQQIQAERDDFQRTLAEVQNEVTSTPEAQLQADAISNLRERFNQQIQAERDEFQRTLAEVQNEATNVPGAQLQADAINRLREQFQQQIQAERDEFQRTLAAVQNNATNTSGTQLRADQQENTIRDLRERYQKQLETDRDEFQRKLAEIQSELRSAHIEIDKLKKSKNKEVRFTRPSHSLNMNWKPHN